MHSPEVLKLLQRVLAPPASSSPPARGEGNTSLTGVAALVDVDDEMGSGVLQVQLDEDLLKNLRFFLPDALVLAALDIVDRDDVVRYTSPLQRVQYQVAGTKKNHYVFPNLPVWTDCGVNRYFCDCPAFTLSVLSAESNFMCKHLLATCLAEKLGRTVERKLDFEEWAALMSTMSNRENQYH